MLIDSHCHINSLSREEKERLFEQDLTGYRFIDSTIDMETTHNSLSMAQWYPYIATAIGFHPFSCEQFNDGVIDEYQDIIDANKKIIAVGEIGLDYKAVTPLQKQEEIFRKFVELAYRNNLPIIIHNRFDQKLIYADGVPYIFTIINEMVSSYANIMFHCFSYDRRFLDMVVEKGGYASFSLNILRGNPRTIESLKHCPIDNLLLETDSPYMKIKDQLSTPMDITRVYDFAAFVRGVKRDELADAVCNNAQKLFKFQ